MQHSSGIIVIHKSTGKILACHPTGRSYSFGNYDIPKGHIEIGEDAQVAAIRELAEETGIIITDEEKINLIDLGVHTYRPDKDLHVFVIELDFDVNTLHCESTFEANGKDIPEMNNYALTNNMKYFYRSLEPIVNTALTNYEDMKMIGDNE